MNKTLILVDLQNDFMPGGVLTVSGADQIIPLVNRLIPSFDHVIATLDWHPPHHVSFASSGGKWPDHCIQGSWGAALVKNLHQQRIEKVFHKGTDPQVDSYSVFFDDRRRFSTGLADYLKQHKLQHLFFCGVATEYCVLYSVLDALELGFSVSVIRDACRPINLRDGERAMGEMEERGAQMFLSEQIRQK